MDMRDKNRLGANCDSRSRGAHFRPANDVDANWQSAGGSHQGASMKGRGGFPLKRAAIVAVAVLAMCGAGGAVAWFGAQDNALNTFTRGEITPSIEETFDQASRVKRDVYVTNKGTAPAYVRAAVSIYWEDEQGNQLWESPVEGVSADYTIEWGAVSEDNNPRWIKGKDGYYYWSVPVGAGEKTKNLINEVKQVVNPATKRLVVDIATQALQANMSPSEGFSKVWANESGLSVGADGVLAPAAGN